MTRLSEEQQKRLDDEALAQGIVREWAEHDMNEHYNSDYLRGEFGSEHLEERIAIALTTVRQEFALCRQVQKRGEHSSVTCACVTAVEDSIRQEERQVVQRDRPKIICLCGSTRFIEQFAITTWELEREGYIVLGCTLLPMWYCNTPSHFGEATGTKEQCDELHKRKIDLADEVLVLNIGGYIGESTTNEIEYATRLGKPVRYVEAAASEEAKGDLSDG